MRVCEPAAPKASAKPVPGKCALSSRTMELWVKIAPALEDRVGEEGDGGGREERERELRGSRKVEVGWPCGDGRKNPPPMPTA